ncbi:hypothetical protein [Desulfobacter latus]|uniref:Uncharacterized protein n=1 Tax=Desulfobacter latus TaxID=2292 RepID=A0A850T649_9BACT|nr:hypothetical protein [Desulfobacter latus]NWH04802.1 hypothetical protein [Desulfobacter latus]
MKTIILALATILAMNSTLGYAEETTMIDKVKHFFSSDGENPLTPSIKEIVDQTQEVKDDIKDLSSNYVIKNIKQYNQMIEEIKDEAGSRKWFLFKRDDAEQFDILYNGIKEIRDFYQDLKKQNKNGKITKELRAYARQIDDFIAVIPRKIAENNQTKQMLQDQLKHLENLDPEKAAVRSDALSHRIMLCDKRIEMLSGFSQNFAKMRQVVADAGKSIDRFVFTVDESALVYDDVYKTLKLGRDISTAYRTLKELQSLDDISKNIMLSWKNLDEIVNALTANVTDFN